MNGTEPFGVIIVGGGMIFGPFAVNIGMNGMGEMKIGMSEVIFDTACGPFVAAAGSNASKSNSPATHSSNSSWRSWSESSIPTTLPPHESNTPHLQGCGVLKLPA